MSVIFDKILGRLRDGASDSGDSIKYAVRVATAVALPANTRTGNVLLADVNGALGTIDGVTMVVADRVLVKDEVTGANRGWYSIDSLGSAGTKWQMTRTSDADTSAEIVSGVLTAVEEGTANADKLFMLTTNNPITINVTSLTFTSTGVVTPVPISSGGTGQITAVAGFDALSPTTTQGDIIYYDGADNVRLGIGGANTLLHGGATAPSYSAVVEADITLADNTTNNADATKHGFLPKLSNNAAQFLNGQGNYATPSGTANSYSATSFTAQTSVTVTHGFGAYPVVQIIDNTGAVIIPLTTTNASVNAFTVTFTGSTTGTIIASVGSPQPYAYISVNSAYPIVSGDYTIECTSGTFAVTLPTSVGATGRIYVIKSTSSGTITINTTGGQTIDGNASGALTLSQYDSYTVQSNGTNWIII